MANYLIIGGSSGIGQALVKLLSQQNHKVFASYFQGEHLQKVEGVHYLHLDTSLPLPLDMEIPEILDGLVYCPGTIDLKPFNRIKPETFLEDYNLQVLGAIRCFQTFLPNLQKSTAPSVLFFSTVAVQTGFPFHSLVSASKGAIEGLTKALAAEYASKIRVNAIAPSLTDTPLASRLVSTEEKKLANAQRNPMKKIGRAEDLAEMASFLLSDKSAWMTGQIIHVDGGTSSLQIQ